MRPIDELLRLLATAGHTTIGEPVPPTDVVVGPLSATGATTPVGGTEAPMAGLYHARARGSHIVIDADEMSALRDAGAAYDDGQIE